MTAKEFLQRFTILQRSVDSKLDQIAGLQSTSRRTTAVIQSVPIGNSADVSRVEDSVVKIYDYTVQLAEELARAVDAREEIAEAISRVPNSDERCLLELRYLCRDSWEQIAKRMHFSLQGVFKLHSRALKNFPFSKIV